MGEGLTALSLVSIITLALVVMFCNANIVEVASLTTCTLWTL